MPTQITDMIKLLHFLLAAIALMSIHCHQALAERKPDKPKDATHIVSGTVDGVFHRETKEQNQYIAQIRVETVERGDSTWNSLLQNERVLCEKGLNVGKDCNEEARGWKGRIDERRFDPRNQTVDAINASAAKDVEAKDVRDYYADGWVIDVGWIADGPITNGLQINFADGTSAKVAFSEPVLADLEKREPSIYYFHASVDENDSSVLSRELSPRDVKSACLLAAEQPVSANFTVDISDAKPIWRKDEKNNSDSAEVVGAGQN